MPNVARGEKPRRNSDGSYTVRITVGDGKKREPFRLGATVATDAQAEARRDLLAGYAARFRRAGKMGDPDAQKLLEMAAASPEVLLRGVEAAVVTFLGGQQVRQSNKEIKTFEQIGKMWTSGELHKAWPDRVEKKKDTSIDAGRLAHLSNVLIGGMRAGDIPIDKFTDDHADEMMRHLPEDAKTSATRRHYAGLIIRVCNLAVSPLKQIKHSPIPKDFRPKAGKPPKFPYLWPDEVDRFEANVDATPWELRMFFGFLAREGLRESEAMALQVRDFNLSVKGDDSRGNVKLDENKSDDPRSWALDPGVARALKRWVDLKKLKPEDLMFMDEDGHPLTLGHRLAEKLRGYLFAAGVDRWELHNKGTNTGHMRAHDLRGTFVTLSLANGKTETWVMDRTGHGDSKMVNRYRRQQREAEQLDLGPLSPMDLAIPELRPDGPTMAQQNAGSPATTAVSQGYGVLRFRAEVPRRAGRLRRSGVRR
jgi:integrase